MKARPLLRIGKPGHAFSCVTGYGFLQSSSFPDEDRGEERETKEVTLATAKAELSEL